MSPRRVTLAEVAKAAGVSPTTASFVLSGRGPEMRISRDVEQRVLRTAGELQYRPNIVSVGLRTGTTQTVGFVSDTIATSRFAGDLIRGALEAASKRGVMLFIGETEGDPDLEHRLVQAMQDRQVDGLILASMSTRTIDVPRELTSGPAVLLNALPSAPTPLASVIPDEAEAGRAAARVLLDAGHRGAIHTIGAGPTPDDVPEGGVAAVERLSGIRETLTAAGVTLAGGVMFHDWEPEHGFTAVRALLQREQPEALICFNDRLALGAYQALADAGLRVPDDVSVVSFDDDDIASWIRPGLTSIALPHYELGRTAIDVLFDAIEQRGATPSASGAVHRVAMPVRTRASVAAPRARRSPE